MSSDRKIAFVGGSFTSLLLALHLSENDKKQKIIVIEKDSEPGGLYRSFHYPEESVKFDIGVHLIGETGNPIIDDLVFNLLEENDWVVKETDISGTFYKNELQTHTPFVDLRNISQADKDRYIADLYKNLDKDIDPMGYHTAKDFLEAKFGTALCEEILRPILEKQYHETLENLDPMATFLLPVGRVVLYDEDEMEELMADERLRARIAYPNQFSLPECYRKKARLFYPKKFGIHQIIDALVAKLKSHGVEILTQASLESMDIEEQNIQSITIKQGEKEWSENIKELYWGAGLPLLAKQLKLDLKLKKPKFKKSVLANLIYSFPPNMGRLHYTYNFDPGFSSFRITNYSSFCPTARSKYGYPVCVTLWPDEEHEGNLVELAHNELLRMGIISKNNRLTFSKIESMGNGFPLATCEYIEQVDKIRDAISQQKIKNLSTIGSLAKKGHFYLKEILDFAFEQAPVKTSLRT